MNPFINVKTKRIILNLGGTKVAELHYAAREAFMLWVKTGKVLRTVFIGSSKENSSQ